MNLGIIVNFQGIKPFFKISNIYSVPDYRVMKGLLKKLKNCNKVKLGAQTQIPESFKKIPNDFWIFWMIVMRFVDGGIYPQK